MIATGHPWLPETSCTEACVGTGSGRTGQQVWVALRAVRRIALAALVLTALPLLALPLPGRFHAQRIYCRAVLRCLGIRFTSSGEPIRNVRGMLVVSNHISWVDVFAVGALLPGCFVARADLVDWPVVGRAARIANIIPIERRSLRQLPDVIRCMVERLRDGKTVVAFPEGTTYCGPDRGRFRPALFQAAIDSGRPIQPLSLTYHCAHGGPSTVTAFLGADSLWSSVTRIVRERRTTVHVQVRPLQIPITDRGRLSALCESAVHPAATSHSTAPGSTVRPMTPGITLSA